MACETVAVAAGGAVWGASKHLACVTGWLFWSVSRGGHGDYRQVGCAQPVMPCHVLHFSVCHVLPLF